ncbi:MAG: hypothetical protein KC736_03735 [Candidatus Moranbacteria bacterium]|nr:hypothetical protein [Candidatus Moranbacteria bacterium]
MPIQLWKTFVKSPVVTDQFEGGVRFGLIAEHLWEPPSSVHGDDEESLSFGLLDVSQIPLPASISSRGFLTFDDFFYDDYLSGWQDSSFRLGFCLPDDVLFLRVHYREQPSEEILCVGMRPIVVASGDHVVFTLEKDGPTDPFLYIRTTFFNPSMRVSLDKRIIFRLYPRCS